MSHYTGASQLEQLKILNLTNQCEQVYTTTKGRSFQNSNAYLIERLLRLSCAPFTCLFLASYTVTTNNNFARLYNTMRSRQSV